jgi:hypothetical protein
LDKLTSRAAFGVPHRGHGPMMVKSQRDWQSNGDEKLLSFHQEIYWLKSHQLKLYLIICLAFKSLCLTSRVPLPV